MSAPGSAWVWLNGALVREADARISPFDRGFLLGDAVFETMRAYGSRPHALDAHIARLRRSCEATRIPFPENIEEAVAAVVRANALQEAAVRVTVSRGPGGRGASPIGAGPATVLVTATPVHHRPEVYERGLRLVISRRRRIGADSLPQGIKTTNYLVHVLARMEAEDAGADDALFVDDEGHVVEATQANVFARFGRRLLTPPLTSGCLPGETRAAILAIASQAGYAAEERALPVEALRGADEVFLTASVLEVAPVVEIDGVRIGDGAPGEAARTLHALYRAHVRPKSP